MCFAGIIIRLPAYRTWLVRAHHVHSALHFVCTDPHGRGFACPSNPRGRVLARSGQLTLENYFAAALQTNSRQMLCIEMLWIQSVSAAVDKQTHQNSPALTSTHQHELFSRLAFGLCEFFKAPSSLARGRAQLWKQRWTFEANIMTS